MQPNELRKIIKPLVKWTGGKYEEFPKFAQYIPSFANYYEPFFGGGGVFFALQPSAQSFVNDKSTDLISFYRMLPDPEFKIQLFELLASWEAIRYLYEDFSPFILTDFERFLASSLSQADFLTRVDEYFDQAKCHKLLRPLTAFTKTKRTILLTFLINSTKDKFVRVKRIVDRERRIFDQATLNDHIETALRSGFYMYIRRLMNEGKRIKLSPHVRGAVWYFVRELCYASMFRFNAKGDFNIPYGGIAYNRKNLRSKVNALFTEEVADIFEKCQLSNLDFEEFLNKTRPQRTDFIFLDPPYDSEFSEYDRNVFTQQDQVRLRDCLHKQSAQWMMVIKETAFIRQIYEEIGAHFIDFDKIYSYNVRGRNNRETKHLIITNYTPKL